MDGKPVDGAPAFRADAGKASVDSMLSASSYEELMSCWNDLNIRLQTSHGTELKEHGTLAYLLDFIRGCFSRPSYGCDSGVKQIFENARLRQELKEMGVPEEFLLNCVRIGSVKGLQDQIEKSPGKPIRLYSDGTMSRLMDEEIEAGRLQDPEAERKRLIGLIRKIQHDPNIDGYSWANEQLAHLVEAKEVAKQEELAQSARELATRKEATIDKIQKQMHEPGFRFSPADAVLLRPDFRQKLQLWKGILESGVGSASTSFLEKNGNKEITIEIFQEFKRICDTCPAAQSSLSHDSLPLEIMNPESGWFSVLIINKQTKLKEFFTSVYCNMNGWFEL